MEFSKFEKIIIALLLGVAIIFTFLRQFQKPSIDYKTGLVSKEVEEIKEEEPQGDIYVHVAGAVVNPGLLKLQTGSRVIDAVELAGGLTEDADIDAVNLALKLQDEDRIYIPRISEEGEKSIGVESAKVNINTATQEELERVPGIGEKTAQKIVDYRKNNTFKNPEDIMKVPGIGEGKYSQMKDYISVK